MKYKQVLIYYFSGTGNAKNAAKWIAETADESGIESKLINIEHCKPIEIQKEKCKILVGFCTPTHGFNVPPIMLKFISQFPKIKNADAFILNTRGGLKLHKLFLPGLSGIAQLLPAIMLRIKGFRIVGMQPLDLPSNWIILHPGLRKKVVSSIYDRCYKIVRIFAGQLINGKRKYKALLSLPFDLPLIPIAVGYYLVGRFILAKTLFANNACDNCNACIKQCPVNAIKATSNLPFWTYKCESCMRCINKCPQRAIQTAHGYVVLVLIAFYTFLIPFILTIMKEYNIEIENQSELLAYAFSIVKTIIFLLLMFASYWLVHRIMKSRIVNWVITYSSLSKFKFWRRYKSPRKMENINTIE